MSAVSMDFGYTLPKSHLKLTQRGRTVFTALAAIPVVIAAFLFAINGEAATASLESSVQPGVEYTYVTIAAGQSLWAIAEDVAEEAAEFETLLDLFEEDLDVPAPPVEVAYGARAPCHVVGDEYHDPPLAVYFHPCLHAPKSHPLVLSLQRDDLILDDILMALGVMPLHHPKVMLSLARVTHQTSRASRSNRCSKST